VKALSAAKRFSVRQGIEPEPSPHLDEAPQPLRFFLLKYLEGKYSGYPWHAAEILEQFLRRPGLKNKFHNPHDPTIWTRMYSLIEGFEWWKVYDFAEAVFNARASDNIYDAQLFERELNRLFEEQNIPYRMSGGDIAFKGSESFEAAVRKAKLVLGNAGRQTAKDEIHKALEDLSRRPPDLTGAVHHAMAALECVATDVCGEEGETLGQVIKKHPDKFPAPLGDGVAKLYGFASDKGRHITEGGEPNVKEVELIVGIAATVATYLSR
jgi:AbiJ N-terminal domain 4